MSLFGGDNELGNILQEAVKLKSAQMNDKRRTYEKWPFFVQHTLYHGEKDDFKAWRQLPFSERMVISERIKEEGNQLYASASYSDAVDKYEEAASLFHYCYSTDPGWRKNNRGIDDDVIVFVDDVGHSEEEGRQQKRLRLTCCLNLAACKQKLEKYDEVIAACDCALELDPCSIKALYRRAEARVRPSGSTAYDLDLAISDLTKAHNLDKKNTAVDKLLFRLRGERKVQRDKDSKTFTGLFDRGELYNEAEEASLKQACSNETPMREIQQRIDGITDDDPIDKRCADAELLRDLYMRNGKEEEAKELNEKIKEAKAAIKREKNSKPRVDWRNPTPEMIADAKNYDLDLTDPAVIEEMINLEKQGELDGKMMGDDDVDSGTAAPRRSGSTVHNMAANFDSDVHIPWMRYVVLFAVIFSIWTLIHRGAIRWMALHIWQRLPRMPRISSYLRGLAADYAADEEHQTAWLAGPVRVLASLIGTDGEDGEL